VIVGAGISFWPGPFISFSLVSWSYFDWHRRSIYVNIHKRPRFFGHHGRHPKPGRWSHSPRHRRGVAYRDKPTARKYGKSSGRSRTFKRDIRGFPERQRTVGKDRKYQPASRPQRPASHGGGIVRDQKVRIDQGRKTSERVKRQERVRKERVERGGSTVRAEKRPGIRRDKIFGNIGYGAEERKSSRRGRISREGPRMKAPSRNPSGSYNRGRRNR